MSRPEDELLTKCLTAKTLTDRGNWLGVRVVLNDALGDALRVAGETNLPVGNGNCGETTTTTYRLSLREAIDRAVRAHNESCRRRRRSITSL